MANGKWSNLIARVFIGMVLVVNVQCAVLFLAAPTLFAPGFELTGLPGDVMVRGMGILFLMWNVPYVVAVSNPRKRRVSHLEAIIMQTIGLVGEYLIWLGIPAGNLALRATGIRFIIFDGTGLLLLIVAFWIVRRGA